GTGADGTVFKFTKKGAETVLVSFGGLNGKWPIAGLVLDGSGNLYGATDEGGTKDYGVIFKVAPDGRETVTYSFCQYTNCSDGALPNSAPIIDSSGNLYGSTIFGGENQSCGVVYKISPSGTETIVHAFLGGADPCQPAGLIFDRQGDFLGVSGSGGKGC